jgi:galactokinase
MYETHEGLSHDYQVSCLELDFLVEHSQNFEAVVGARMMGGGFGGCTLNLVETSAADEFIKNISLAYHETFNIHLQSYIVNISNGVEELEKELVIN